MTAAARELNLLPDGRWIEPESGEAVRPPGRVEFRLDRGVDESYIALFVGGHVLTPDLMHELIDFYGFVQKHCGGTKIVIGTG